MDLKDLLQTIQDLDAKKNRVQMELINKLSRFAKDIAVSNFCDAMYNHASDIPQLTQLSATIIDNDIHNIQIGSKVSADFKDAISFQTALAGTCSLVFDINSDHVVKNIKLIWN